MENKESLKAKFDRLSKTIASIPNKFSEAIEEGLQEDYYRQLICVQQGKLDHLAGYVSSRDSLF